MEMATYRLVDVNVFDYSSFISHLGYVLCVYAHVFLLMFSPVMYIMQLFLVISCAFWYLKGVCFCNNMFSGHSGSMNVSSYC